MGIFVRQIRKCGVKGGHIWNTLLEALSVKTTSGYSRPIANSTREFPVKPTTKVSKLE